MRRSTTSFALILLALAAAVLPPHAAGAQTGCKDPEPTEVVFEGESTGQVDTKFDGPEGTTPYGFDVEQVLEGDVGDRAIVWVRGDERPVAGERYRVSAARSNEDDSLNALLVTECSVDPFQEATGPEPKESNPGNVGLMAPLVGVGGILLLLVVAALVQKDRSAQTVT